MIMSHGSRVSVVLIFLNAEPFLEEAVASVLAQSMGDWELLLIDDGSTDRSSSMARHWAAAHPDRIRYFDHQGHRNLGMSAARNLGLRHAGGEFVTFLDADDVLRTHALEALAARLTAEPSAALAYGPVEYWFSWAPGGGRRPPDFIQALGVPADALLQPPSVLVRFLRRRGAVPSGVMVRTEVARAVGGFEEAFRGMYEDQAFCAKVCASWPVVTTGVSGYRYRQHAGSSSAAAERTGQPEYGREAFLRWLEGYLERQGIRHGPVVEALRREVWWLQHPRLLQLARGLRRGRRRLARRLRRRSG